MSNLFQNFRQRIDELVKQNDRLQKQVTHLKERELTLTAEVKNLRDDVTKKASLLIKMKEDKMKFASHGVTSSDPGVAASREAEELRHTIRQLEEKLRIANRAEKPLEDSGPSTVAENEKALKTTEELAR